MPVVRAIPANEQRRLIGQQLRRAGVSGWQIIDIPRFRNLPTVVSCTEFRRHFVGHFTDTHHGADRAMRRDAMPRAERHSVVNRRRPRLAPRQLRLRGDARHLDIRAEILRPGDRRILDRQRLQIRAKLNAQFPLALCRRKEFDDSIAQAIGLAVDQKPSFKQIS